MSRGILSGDLNKVSSIHQCLSVCMSVGLSVYLFIYLSVYISFLFVGVLLDVCVCLPVSS